MRPRLDEVRETDLPLYSPPVQRLRWLVQLRWLALSAAAFGLLVNQWAAFPWVSPRPIAAAVLVGVLYNIGFLLRLGRAQKRSTSFARELELHAIADVGALTLLLSACGGLRNPISMFYGFHVVLGAMLGLFRGALLSGLVAMFGVGLLCTAERHGLLLSPPLLSPPLWLCAGATVLTILSLGFFALLALRFLQREQGRALRKAILLERLASLGRALQGVAHELATPLSSIQTLAVDLSHSPRLTDSADDAESISLIIDEARRCREITRELLANVREGEPGPRVRTVLQDVVVRAARLTYGSKPRHGGVVFHGDPGMACLTDSDRLLQILVNLLQNARDAAEGPVEVLVDRRDRDVVLEVRDHGPGLPREVRERLFMPFVTTKPPGQGTGLGLYTCARLAQQLSARLSIEDAPGGGVCARLVLHDRLAVA